MSTSDKNQQKDAIKEAMQEWLDEKFSEFGKWTLRSLAALVFSAGVYIYLYLHGGIK